MTEPYFADERAVLFRGDSTEVLRALPDASVDAVVTDPPAGISFMAKGWDSDKGGRDAWIAWLRDIMREVLRVLKPGAHGLVWALPRTSHWTATALEDAGFEVRDVHMHIFGTGFPKSLDVSKAIDASVGAKREIVGKGASNCADLAAGRECTCYLTRVEMGQSGATKHTPATAPGSPDAEKWSGWGTALKPAAEHWILVRKPLGATVAACVLEYGTGALNIDACRIGIDERYNPPAVTKWTDAGYMGRAEEGKNVIGRWPAHVSFDEEAAAELDEQSGAETGSNGRRAGVRGTPGYKGIGGMTGAEVPANKGGASRFFYVAKGSRSEKDLGCEALPARSGGEATDREDGSAGLNNPRAGAGRTGGARNHHPTVKSIALMRWLVRLVTPPNGLILDCFTGSGSTAVAALAEGFSFVGVERDLDDDTGLPLGYCDIARARIEHALKETK